MHNWVKSPFAAPAHFHSRGLEESRSRNMETATMIAFAVLLALTLHGLTSLLLRKPQHG